MTKNLKKYLILGFLFFFPIFVYVFLSTGINNFAKLPVLTQTVMDIENIEGNSTKVSFKNKISIVAFWGGDVNSKKSEALNLNQKIYKRFNEFQDFQFVLLHNKNDNQAIEDLKSELVSGVGTDLKNWNFIPTTQSNIKMIFESFKTNIELDQSFSTQYVFIVDRDLSLRGRDDDEDIGVLYGFDSQSVAEINNKMVDDVKIILAEYRLALKKNDSLFNE
jgi:DNA-directed RNA polymerase subunit F